MSLSPKFPNKWIEIWPLRVYSAAHRIARSEVLMARITVEDCLQHVPNLFQLVLVASKRARKLANGAEPTVEWENDKMTVVALREIAAGHIGPEILEEVERPVVEPLPEPEMSGELRAPHLGLGD